MTLKCREIGAGWIHRGEPAFFIDLLLQLHIARHINGLRGKAPSKIALLPYSIESIYSTIKLVVASSVYEPL